MTELLQVRETMSSLEIAQLTGKQHAHVMRDIRTLLEQGVHESNFGLMFKITKLGNGAERKDPYYELTKKGCLILASGYDAKLRERIIDRWEELETEKRNGGFQVPTSFKEALLLAAHQQELIEEQQKQIEQKQILIEQKEAEISIKDGTIKILAPKGETYDAIMSSQGLVTINMIAAFLGISAKKLNLLLCQWGVQYKQSKCYFLTSRYRNKGYTKHVPFPYLDNGVQKSREHMYWTEAGRKFVIDLYNSKKAA